MTRNLRIEAALRGDLEAYLREELATAEKAVTMGVRETTDDVKRALRRDVVRGGLGQRLARSWRSKVFPKGGASLEAAGFIWTKAEDLVAAFDRSTTIRSKEGNWLAIPTSAAPAKGLGRKRLTPSNFPENRYGPLRFVYRPSGASLLVVDNQRERRGKSGGFALSRSKRALKTGYGLSTVPMFFLVPQVRLRRRLNVRRTADQAAQGLARNIDRAITFLDRRSGV